MKRLTLLLLLLVPGCSESGSYPTVTIKGAPVEIEWSREDPQRLQAPAGHTRLADARGILCGWPYDRILHYHSKTSQGGYEVLFLAADGRVVDRQVLPAESEEGITSRAEARYALFLADGWSARHNAGDADRIALSAAVTDNPPAPMPEVKIGGVPLRVEIAATGETVTRGLMHRRTMSAEDGMVFVYPDEGKSNRSFWMKNCHYGLDIAFFGKNGAFINLVTMDPYPDPTKDPGEAAPGGRAPSEGLAQYVIEAHKGWFKAKGLVDDQGKATREVRLELGSAIREYTKKLGGP